MEKKQIWDCGGSGIVSMAEQKRTMQGVRRQWYMCEHGKEKRYCKSVRAAVYEHGRQGKDTRSAEAAVYVTCMEEEAYKDCGGSSLCEHGRRKK
jgi:hypothetical protein